MSCKEKIKWGANTPQPAIYDCGFSQSYEEGQRLRAWFQRYLSDGDFEPSLLLANQDQITANKKNFHPGRPKRGRKRFPGQTDRTVRKKKTDTNNEYYSARGKLVKAKEFIPSVCSCAMECYDKVSVDDRRSLFNHYWSLDDYNVQTTFIATYESNL